MERRQLCGELLEPKSPNGEMNSALDMVGFRPMLHLCGDQTSRKYESEGRGLCRSYRHINHASNSE